jgi:hypothetical protein
MIDAKRASLEVTSTLITIIGRAREDWSASWPADRQQRYAHMMDSLLAEMNRRARRGDPVAQAWLTEWHREGIRILGGAAA